MGVLHHVFKKGQCLRHVLAKAIQGDVDTASTYVDVVVASEFVELLLYFLVAHLVGAKIFKVIGSHAITEVGLVAKLIAETHCETAILFVLHINVRQSGLGLAEGEVFLEVDETGLDRRYGLAQDATDKVALHIAVGGDGRDGGLVDFFLVFVHTLTLVDHHIVVVEVLFGEGHDLFLGHAFHAIEIFHILFPRSFKDE